MGHVEAKGSGAVGKLQQDAGVGKQGGRAGVGHGLTPVAQPAGAAGQGKGGCLSLLPLIVLCVLLPDMAAARTPTAAVVAAAQLRSLQASAPRELVGWV